MMKGLRRLLIWLFHSRLRSLEVVVWFMCIFVVLFMFYTLSRLHSHYQREQFATLDERGEGRRVLSVHKLQNYNGVKRDEPDFDAIIQRRIRERSVKARAERIQHVLDISKEKADGDIPHDKAELLEEIDGYNYFVIWETVNASEQEQKPQQRTPRTKPVYSKHTNPKGFSRENYQDNQNNILPYVGLDNDPSYQVLPNPKSIQSNMVILPDAEGHSKVSYDKVQKQKPNTLQGASIDRLKPANFIEIDVNVDGFDDVRGMDQTQDETQDQTQDQVGNQLRFEPKVNPLNNALVIDKHKDKNIVQEEANNAANTPLGDTPLGDTKKKKVPTATLR